MKLRPPALRYVIGVNAPPGSGKGTIVQILVFLMKLAAPGQLVRDDTTELAAEAGLRNRAAAASAHSAERALRVVNVSSDDLYMGRAKRAASGIATRLDPRSLDRAHYGVVEALASARAGETVRIPIFSKAEDDATSFAEVEGPFDVVIYEGWRVGVRPGEFYGPGGEGGAFEYEELNRPINYLMCARATRARERERAARARARALSPRWGRAPRNRAREAACIRASLLPPPLVFPPLLPRGTSTRTSTTCASGSCARAAATSSAPSSGAPTAARGGRPRRRP